MTCTRYYLLLLTLTAILLQAQTEEYTDGKLIRKQAAWAEPEAEKVSAVDDYIWLYQKFISGSRGSACAMYPSCSNFGKKTFRETNFLNAMTLTSERLMRCGHEHKYYDLTYQGEEMRLLDFPAYAQNPDSLIYKPEKELFAYAEAKNSEDKSLGFVKSLINDGYYTEALLEINRLQYLDKRTDTELYLNKIICLRALNEGEKAVFEYETKFPKTLQSDPNMVMQVAMTYFDLNNYKRAQSTISRMDTIAATPLAVIRAHRMQGVASAHLGKWSDAKQAFAEANRLQPNPAQMEKNEELLRKAMTFKPKSAKKASLLSIIPGLGYLYTGHKQTAFTSFAINGLLGYATYTSIKSKNYGVAAIMGVFGGSFYVGNIFGAGRSADRYNDNHRKQILQSLDNNNTFNY